MELVEVVVIGLPFCAFKILTGLSLLASSAPSPLKLLAFALIGLGAVDALINGVNFAGYLLSRRRMMDACFLSLATRPFRRPQRPHRHWQDLGNSLDVLLSFSLVAAMIGYGRLKSMPADQLAVWNACVILNVLGAGLSRFSESLRNLKSAR